MPKDIPDADVLSRGNSLIGPGGQVTVLDKLTLKVVVDETGSQTI